MSAPTRDPPGLGDPIERFAPDRDGPIITYEHWHRYAMSAELVEGLRVLDLGSGSGYGTRLLRAGGAEVVALELDRHCAGRATPAAYGNAVALPFADRTFDAVVCFEVVEHVSTPSTIFAEIVRVLREPGFALISTPDRSVYTDRTGNRNPYHLAEMKREEFAAELGLHFSEIELYGQSVWAGSWIARLDASGATPGPDTREIKALLAPSPPTAATPERAPWVDPGESSLPTPLYLIAVCAQRESTASHLSRRLSADNLLHDRFQQLLGHYLASLEARVRQEHELEESAKHARNLTDHRISAETHAENLESLLSEEREKLQALREHVQNLETEQARRRKLAQGLEEHARNLEEWLEQRNAHLENLERILAERSEHLENLQVHALNLEGLLEQRNAHLSNIEHILAEKSEHLENLEVHALNLEGLLEQRNAHLSNIEHILAEKSEHLENLEVHALNLEGLLEQRNAHLSNIEHILADQRRQLQDMRADTRNLEAENTRLLTASLDSAHALAELQSSGWVRTLQRLRLIK